MTPGGSPAPMLGWAGILRMGLVQLALGSLAVIAISTLNRVLVIEYAMPATVPGALIALHYFVQMLRPRFGHGSDVGGRRTPWILGGLLVVAAGVIAAAAATSRIGSHSVGAFAADVAAYVAIGLGIGAAGTSLLALVAKSVAPTRRAAAATILWIMMIAGFAITSGLIGRFLDPFSGARLLAVVTVASVTAWCIAFIGLIGVERTSAACADPGSVPPKEGANFRAALAVVWREPTTRRFTLFIFVSMLAFSALELVLEPFAGQTFHLSPGASARIASGMHSGAVLGMLAVAIVTSLLRPGSARHWVTGGCTACAVMLCAFAYASLHPIHWPLQPSVMLLGFATGCFTVASIGVMMDLAAANDDGREGMRMGLWGGAQAIAFAIGGLCGSGIVDLARHLLGSTQAAYGLVFGMQALLFACAALISVRGARAPLAIPRREANPYLHRPGTSEPA